MQLLCASRTPCLWQPGSGPSLFQRNLLKQEFDLQEQPSQGLAFILIPSFPWDGLFIETTKMPIFPKSPQDFEDCFFSSLLSWIFFWISFFPGFVHSFSQTSIFFLDIPWQFIHVTLLKIIPCVPKAEPIVKLFRFIRTLDNEHLPHCSFEALQGESHIFHFPLFCCLYLKESTIPCPIQPPAPSLLLG